jgi:uncharacterized protein (TIGR00251 family)
MESARLEIRLKPRAKSDRISLGPAGLLAVAVTSPPVDDRANEHLVMILSDRLGVAKGRIAILRGGHSRNKVVQIDGMTREEIVNRLISSG